MRTDKPVFPLFLFPSVSWWQNCLEYDHFVVEVYENWIKQSPRSRFTIATTNGRQTLSIPTVRSTRTRLNEVEISEEGNWRTLHWRTIQTAYNRSPYFEYYADGIRQILETKHKHLIDMSLEALDWCFDKLNMAKSYEIRDSYVEEAETDFRSGQLPYNEQTYFQVFDEKTGFQSDLSVLDVLFNLGPEAIRVLAAGR